MVADARCFKCGGVKIPNGTTTGEPPCICNTVKEIDPRKEGADYVRSVLHNVVTFHQEKNGDDIAGFALITWDRRGTPTTGYLCNQGMVHRALMPSYAADALNQHVIMDMANERIESVNVPPDGGKS